ncbi:mucin-5AC isoform X2 [Drosophila ficusphila]|nr:mucin-5AC isoform X2 [Drosophila ficusphila]XP_017044754.1 mucin-5AC isoform X2 [Drosophila ficusphila]XP_017044755.1 mucin-5AC isoform X2 [Drosophila ficusphila]XP_017044756.1 mucin-5AC isoform X2 [Drosophila ficusphila]XP_017044757.1 mucin-5AC isoform X2 [Drosophila ficusphila]XP_017044758.1 mucin-5AC isoform X2 [Drosophila ficusphila]
MGAQHTDTDTYSLIAARDLNAEKSRAFAISPAKMPRPSLLLSLLTLGSLLLLTIDASPVFVDNPSLAQFQSGRNIRHLPCIVRKSGRSGVCMFAIDCIKQNGTHLGTCIDRFYFGSCCAMKEEASLFAPEINDNSIDQNTISHFAHESTTLPTSALFKLTTESSFSSSSSSGSSSSGGGSSSGSTTHQHTTNELLKNVTQSYLSTAKPAPVRTTSNGNSTLATTRRPPLAHTTHKNSHFVVRTTLKPNVVQTTTLTPTVKPPRRRTTTAKPVLTTAPILVEQRIETTSVPTKFVTFQIVETTTPAVTEPTHLQETTTTNRRHTRPTGSSSVASRTTSRTTTTISTTTTTAAPPTTATSTKAAVTTQRPTPPLRTTTQKPHKPHSSRRPAPAKKPANATTTTVSGSQSTRKPVDSLASSSTTANGTTTSTTLPARRPVIQTTSSVSSSSSSTTSSTSTTTGLKDEPTKNRTTTRLPERTTQAPRPKPKPTGEIVKVPVLLADQTTTTVTTDSTSSSSPSETPPSSTTLLVTKKKPTTTTAAPTTSTTTTTTPKPTRRTTTKAPTTTTTRATTTTTKAPTTTTTTTTTTRKPLVTTEAPTFAPLTTTTKKTGLITWTDVEAEPPTNASISSDWIPLASQTTEVANKTSDTTAPPSATDKVVISVATSVSEVESQVPQKTTKPPKATSTAKPTTTTTTTASTTTTTAATTTVKTTEAPASSIELASSTSSYTDLSSEVAASSSSSTTRPTSPTSPSSTTSSPTTTAETTDYSGEEPNTTTIEATGSTTVAPANALEGVDYKEVCGRRMFPEPRIVGGANAAFGRWPWQISLRQWRTSTYLHKCGAALLNENWAITAAHCVDNVPPSDLLLRLGEYDLAEEEEPYGYQERRVQIVASHPQFDPRTFEYDLALLRFYEPVVFQPNIIPVCVPDNDENFIGQTAFVTGWGRLYEDGPLPSVLQEVAVPVINNTICESMYRSAGYIEHIPHIFICAGWKKGGYDSCEGDSGGPMVLQRESDKRFQLGGVISWGIGCAEANQPGVYTRISEFRDWINQILQF